MNASAEVARHRAEVAAREAAEAARFEEVRARGLVPEECGPDIPEAPARGPFRVFEERRLYPEGEGGFVSKPAGFMGRKTIQIADAFDVMAAQARRRKAAVPFNAGQIAMGRLYRSLVERHAAAGVQCSSVETLGRGSGGGSYIDALLAEAEEIERLRRRVGAGSALIVRRQRPSGRGSRRSIPDLMLVDMVCLEDASFDKVLEHHGWCADGKNRAVLREALGKALDRMAGPVRSTAFATRFGAPAPVLRGYGEKGD